jgi:dihydroorotase
VQASVVDTGYLSFADVARVLSSKPAEIGRLAGYASAFAVGDHANFTLYDPAVSREFGVEHLHGKSINSPYLARTLPGQVIATIHNGYATVLDGQLLPASEVAASAGASRG